MRKLLEASDIMSNRKFNKPKAKWHVVEVRVKDNAAVEVSKLSLPIPRYTFRVGTAHFDAHTQEAQVGTRLTTFNAEDAIELLKEVSEEYIQKREEKIEEVERLKEENNGGGFKVKEASTAE